MQCSFLLKDRACIFLCEIFILENGKELHCKQVADMILNDDIGEMESADSLDEKSCYSSSNDEPSS